MDMPTRTRGRAIRWLARALPLAGLALLAACASPPVTLEPTQPEPYRLDAGDRLRVVVFGHPDLSGEFGVTSAGTVAFPLAGEVKAAGLTPSELEAAIVAGLSPKYLRNPRVSVEVLNYRPFYIIGEVRSPGSYPWSTGLTARNAVALAGGYTYRAKEDHVLITRRGATEAQAADPAAQILPGDVIEVPERYF
jgi:protein involved in polysaccharide export with SLBB domain